jgi:hypothetical protein
MVGMFRVRIDVGKIQSNIQSQEGRRLSEHHIRSYLRSLGFVPAEDGGGDTWLAHPENLHILHESEVLQKNPVA